MENISNQEKKEQILQINPSTELKFTGPFTQIVTSHIILTNPSDDNICFKVKTTAPKQYCVRPNSGSIEPKKSFDVAIMLQPFKYDPNEKNKHKFMIQSMVLPKAYESVEQAMKIANPNEIMDSKLKCLFEIPELHGDVDNTTGKVVISDKKEDNDFEKLRHDVESLSQENQKLRMTEIRLRQITMQDKEDIQTHQPDTINARVNNNSPQWFNIILIIIALSMFLLGILMAKLI